jgi:hypothetical protein
MDAKLQGNDALNAAPLNPDEMVEIDEDEFLEKYGEDEESED